LDFICGLLSLKSLSINLENILVNSAIITSSKNVQIKSPIERKRSNEDTHTSQQVHTNLSQIDNDVSQNMSLIVNENENIPIQTNKRKAFTNNIKAIKH
jgi:hypothetical protein